MISEVGLEEVLYQAANYCYTLYDMYDWDDETEKAKHWSDKGDVIFHGSYEQYQNKWNDD